MAAYSEMAAAAPGGEMPAGSDPKPKSQLVFPNCGATFEQVEAPAGEGAGEGMGEGSGDESWEKDLRHMAARTPEAEGQPQ